MLYTYLLLHLLTKVKPRVEGIQKALVHPPKYQLPAYLHETCVRVFVRVSVHIGVCAAHVCVGVEQVYVCLIDTRLSCLV